MCAPTTSQMAALKALEVGAPFVAEMQAEYDRRRRLIVDAFNDFGMPTFEPRGAFYAFPKINIAGMDDDQFATELLTSEQVAVVPGSAFGPGGEGFVRCSYATAYEKIEQAMERIGRFIGKY
jgi:aminotransferase